MSDSIVVCWVLESMKRGKEDKRTSIWDLDIARNWRERTATLLALEGRFEVPLPPRVQIEADRTT